MEAIVTFQDCEKVIKKYGGDQLKVENYQLIPLDTKLGFLGEYFKLKIKCSDDHEKQFFVKTLALAESQRKFVLDNGAATKEEGFYSKFLQKCLENGVELIQDCVPKCYLIQTLDKFILEDLSLENYQVLDARRCLSLQEVEIALKNLAKFHASSYILEESLTKKSGKTYRISNEFSEFLNEAIYTEMDITKDFIKAMKTGVDAHVDLCKNILAKDFDEENFKKNIYKIVDKYPIYVKPSVKYRNVLCHGDLWTTNIMFKHDGDIPIGFKMVDFQMYRYNPPTADVITFLYFCTNRKFRREHFEYCFKFYYDRLRIVLKKCDLDFETIFSKDDFMESIEYYKKFAICQASTYGHLTMIDRKLLSDILSNSDSVGEVMLKTRRVVMEKMFEKDPVYKEKLYELFLDLVDVILK